MEKGGRMGEMMSTKETVIEAILKLEGYGIGPVEPTDQYTDEEITRAVRDSQSPLEDNAIVCIDEREAVNGPELVRLKTGGGAAITGFMAAVMGNWTQLASFKGGYSNQNPNEVFEFVASHLHTQGIKLGAHKDNHADEEKTNCGANDGIPQIAADIASPAINEILPVAQQLVEATGMKYDSKIMEAIVANTRDLIEAGFFNNWDSTKAAKVVEKFQGVVEILNGDNQKPDMDPGDERHNHWAEAINFNLNPDKSNNRDQSVVPFFQLDKAGIDKPVDKLQSSESERNILTHAAILYNSALARKLTKNQRVTVTS